MALAEFQLALANLYVDARARETFVSDASAYAHGFGLDTTETERLRALGSAHVAAYARTLARKRRNEIARLAPRTTAALAADFAATANRYMNAVEYDPANRRPARDARQFARYVARVTAADATVRDVARAEARALSR